MHSLLKYKMSTRCRHWRELWILFSTQYKLPKKLEARYDRKISCRFPFLKVIIGVVQNHCTNQPKHWENWIGSVQNHVNSQLIFFLWGTNNPLPHFLSSCTELTSMSGLSEAVRILINKWLLKKIQDIPKTSLKTDRIASKGPWTASFQSSPPTYIHLSRTSQSLDEILIFPFKFYNHNLH